MSIAEIRGDNSHAGIHRRWLQKSKPEIVRELMRRWDDLDKAQRELVEVRAREKAMQDEIRKARLFAGDNLPAGPGLTLVMMLEKALKGGAA